MVFTKPREIVTETGAAVLPDEIKITEFLDVLLTRAVGQPVRVKLAGQEGGRVIVAQGMTTDQLREWLERLMDRTPKV